MKRPTYFLLVLIVSVVALSSCQGNKTADIRIVATSDVHGNFYPYDFINDRPASGSLARVQTYLNSLRAEWDDRLIYVDNGDILQGQPTAYYYNTVAVGDVHLADQMLNYMGCEVATLGNHDIETGGATYQRYIHKANFHVLGGNIGIEDTGHTFVPPYAVIDRHGVRIAFVGLLTPAIPHWLPRELWESLEFNDMVASARQWMQMLRESERPDVVIGVFHSGRDGGIVTDKYAENATERVAREVPGFDAIIFGHDHQLCCDSVTCEDGRQIPIVNPGGHANYVSQLTVKMKKTHGKWVVEHVDAENVSMEGLEPDADFLTTFEPQKEEVKAYVGKRIGTFVNPISTQDAYFGSSSFMDFIHQMQLSITHADISLAAPLSFNATIPAGDVYVRDMFNLYKYENMLYTMMLTGREVLGHLEMSYGQWVNQMSGPDDHLLLFRESTDGEVGDKNSGKGKPKFRNIYYNFDSAAGIIYEVDVTKPVGQRVHIISMADGTPFDLDKTYRVAVNSYRGNGGGELLTRGAGIPQEELSKRIDYSTDADLRFFMLNYIELRDTLNPQPLGQWKFVPESMAKAAGERDRKLMFD